MLKNVIFDYMGVLADIDYKLLLKNLSTSEKFKVLRIIVAMKKNEIFKKAFDDYQLGTLTKEDLHYIASQKYPRAASVVPKLISLITPCLKENKEVLNLARKLHNDGIKVVLLSNSIPETQAKIETSDMFEYFDGFVLSHHLGMIKPSTDIYNFTCETYGLNPEDTIMIDDTKENLVGAKKANLKALHCDKPQNVVKKLTEMFYGKNESQPNK